MSQHFKSSRRDHFGYSTLRRIGTTVLVVRRHSSPFWRSLGDRERPDPQRSRKLASRGVRQWRGRRCPALTLHHARGRVRVPRCDWWQHLRRRTELAQKRRSVAAFLSHEQICGGQRAEFYPARLRTAPTPGSFSLRATVARFVTASPVQLAARSTTATMSTRPAQVKAKPRRSGDS